MTDKIKVLVSMNYNNNMFNLTIKDVNASTQFLKLKMSPDDYVMAISGCPTQVMCAVQHLDRVGTYMHFCTFKFPMPKCSFRIKRELAVKIATELCPEGWVSDNYFGSQTSFMLSDDGIEWAQTTIRTYLDVERHEHPTVVIPIDDGYLNEVLLSLSVIDRPPNLMGGQPFNNN